MEFNLCPKKEKLLDRHMGGRGFFLSLCRRIFTGYKIFHKKILLKIKILTFRTLGCLADIIMEGSDIAVLRIAGDKITGAKYLTEIILHEGCHLQQFLSRRLVICFTGNYYWRGVRRKEGDYETREWEMEAFKEEKRAPRVLREFLLSQAA